MDEFVHRPKPFKSSAPKIDQIIIPPSTSSPKNTPPAEDTVTVKADTLPIPEISDKPAPDSTTAKKDDTVLLADLPPKPKPKRLSKKKLLIIIGAILVLVLGAGASYWFYFREDSPPVTNNNSTTVEATPTPTPTPISPLTGLEVASATLAARPVTGLMIENSYAARPQSGLLDAGIVFEAIAEGGITRFLALYQEAQPQYIGPIRSIRPYYIDFAMGFDAAVGHAGGSPDALSDIANLGMKNLEVFSHGDVFWRIDEREAPHNVYTSFEKIDTLNTALGYTSSNFTPFARKSDVPQTPTATLIDLSISSYDYSPHFEYDATTNTYKRFQAGEAHTDLTSGTQISPKVVITMVMNYSLMSDGSHSVYQDTGSGPMYVFQDGIVSTGAWSKTSRTSSFILTDKNGLPMSLNAGQTWISIVESETDLNYRL
jgi:hypothetical protein